MNDINYCSAREMLEALKAKRISARELLDAHVARNQQLHKQLNAVIDTDIHRGSVWWYVARYCSNRT